MTQFETHLSDAVYEHVSMPHVIAIASGKGGVGKSSISVNLGIALSRLSKKVCIFDADTGLANINILLGLKPEYSLEHVVSGAKTLKDIMVEAHYGLRVIPGANGITECVSLLPEQQTRLFKDLAAVEHEFDYMLVDTAAGISDMTLDFIVASQHTLIVITPEPTSLTDAFSLIRLLVRRGKQQDYHVVVNMCPSVQGAKEIFHRFSAAVEKYIGVSLAYLGFILHDESLRAAVTLQSPVALFEDNDPSCRAFLRLAQSVDEKLSESVPKGSFSGYWQALCQIQLTQSNPLQDRVQQHLLVASVADARLRLRDMRAQLLALLDTGYVSQSDWLSFLQVLNETAGIRMSGVPIVSAQKVEVGVADGLAQCDSASVAVSTGSSSLMSSASCEGASKVYGASYGEGYDEARFGSQDALLNRLRQDVSVPVLEWLKQF